VPHDLGRRIAAGIAQLMPHAGAERRSADYLDYEPRLIALAGPEASRLHSGRSRQDIASTIARMNLRDGLLQAHAAMVDVRGRLLALAERHTRTIIPAYTHGVQAQPTTFAHYLLAYAAALGRQGERMQQAYARINTSPLGAAALATSSFPLDRPRLAALLGFDGLLENAYDANHLAPVDAFLDLAYALSVAAVQAGQFAQDLHAQYDRAHPWLLLGAAELTGTSSIMPQKRNPAALEQLRAQASLLLGEMQAACLLAHNVRSGMFDYRSYDPVPCSRALQLLKLYAGIADGIVVDARQALDEVGADYATTTEIADCLSQRADVPFRVGHHFASALTDYGRGRRLRLAEIPFAEVQRIYTEQSAQPLPLTEAEFQQIISAEHMVFGRKGLGGPQIGEVARMLGEQRAEAAADRHWHARQMGSLAEAENSLQAAFDTLAAAAAPR